MAAPARPFHPVSMTIHSQDQYGDSALKNPARNFVEHRATSRKWFAALLWQAFPAPSENEVATKAAEALGVSARQVRNWLRGENDAGLSYVCAVMAIAGVEMTIQAPKGRAA